MPRLKRNLTLFDATALSIGAIIGAGIFVISGIASGLAGPAVILSILIAGAVSSLTAFSYVKLSERLSEEGGSYVYAKRELSPFSGFMTGWIWLFANIVTGATVSLGLASYVISLFPQVPLIPMASASVLVLTLLNIVGIKQSSILNGILVTLKVSALVLFIIIGSYHLNFSFYRPFIPNGIGGVLSGAALIFFAYTGFGRPTTAAEEIKDPRKTIPRSIVLAMILSSAIYIMVGIISIGLIPYQNLAHSGSPLADAVDYGIGITWLKLFVSFAAIAATLSVLLTTIIGVSRVSFAMSKDGYLPKILKKIHKKFNTPYLAVLIIGIIMAALPLIGTLKQTANVTNFASLVAYAIVNLSAIMMFKRSGMKTKNIFYMAISLLGLLSCLALLFFLSSLSWEIGIIWIVSGVVYFALKIRKSK